MTTKYRFHLVCPRCGKASSAIADARIPQPRLNCGDCLMNDTEVVEFKVASVEELREPEYLQTISVAGRKETTRIINYFLTRGWEFRCARQRSLRDHYALTFSAAVDLVADLGQFSFVLVTPESSS